MAEVEVEQKLYCWVIQKTEKNPFPLKEYRDNPLPNALALLLYAGGFEDNLLVSPGYLSTTEARVEHFFSSFDAMFKPIVGSIPTDPYVGLLHGMANGATKKAYEALYQKELRGGNHVFRFGPIIELDATKPNHSKVVFFYEPKSGTIEQCLKRYSCQYFKQVAGKLSHLELIDGFLDDIDVCAASIGSSNFSDSTYFGGANKAFSYGETDTLLFAADASDAKSPYSAIVNYYASQDGKAALDSIYDDWTQGERDWFDERMQILQDVVLSEAIYYPRGEQSDLTSYLKDLLRTYLLGWVGA
ncbi:hypothetical protein [Adlercreutzia murintestinalis]|jgi:hypothetical protein|uniref:hypothetical protein n=1 Tax=Adlercreutzia murintestinalis TaxID=2941325 RepID=UPI00203BAF15|nr:hypothetical protein [Adlercreutzia murintestinalis]